MEYHSIRQLEELCKTEQKPVWKIVLKAEQTETDETEKQIFERMRQMYHEMKAADEGYAAELRSASGMAGGDGEKMHRFNVTGKICAVDTWLWQWKSIENGRIQCLYEADRCRSDCRFMRSDPCSTYKL